MRGEGESPFCPTQILVGPLWPLLRRLQGDGEPAMEEGGQGIEDGESASDDGSDMDADE